MSTEKKVQLERLRTKVLNLKKSPLYEYRKREGYVPVMGEGDLNAAIMFVGEAPGKNEAFTGRPFCGRAGVILDELLDSISIEREKVYITSVVKDRPPENRDPTPEEITIYGPFLDQQIEIIQPRILGALGRFAVSYLLGHFKCKEYGMSIGDLHGKKISFMTSYGTATLMPLYHPAALIYNPALRKIAEADFKALKNEV